MEKIPGKRTQIQTFSIEGNPYLRIDGNKVKLDHLGDLPEGPIVKSEYVKELEFQPEPTPKPTSSSRGSLPKGFTKELTQEPESTPKPTSSSRGFITKRIHKRTYSRTRINTPTRRERSYSSTNCTIR